MYKTILVPLDGSKRAEMILSHVEELANRYQSTVILIQVLEHPRVHAGPEGAYFESQADLDQRTARAQEYLGSMQGTLREKGIEAETRLDHAPVVDAVIRAAEEKEVDLIAIASHGRSGLSRVFYGSVAAAMLQRIDRPLLIVRARLQEGEG